MAGRTIRVDAPGGDIFVPAFDPGFMATGWQDGDTLDLVDGRRVIWDVDPTIDRSVELANEWRDECGRFARKGYMAVPLSVTDITDFKKWAVGETGPFRDRKPEDIEVIGARERKKSRSAGLRHLHGGDLHRR